MSNLELNALIHTYFFSQSNDEKIHAMVKLESKGVKVLRPLLEGLVKYIKAIVASRRSPHPQAVTPAQQLMTGYLTPIQHVLIAWEVKKQPVVETLSNLFIDPNRNIRALAVLSLGSGSPMWADNQLVKEKIQLMQRDTDSVICSAASFALDFFAQAERFQRGLPADLAIRQRMEQSAAQIINGIGQR